MTWTQYGSFGNVDASSDQHTLLASSSAVLVHRTSGSIGSGGSSGVGANGGAAAGGAGALALQYSAAPAFAAQVPRPEPEAQQAGTSSGGSSGSSVVIPAYFWPSPELAKAGKASAGRASLRALRPGQRYYSPCGLRGETPSKLRTSVSTPFT